MDYSISPYFICREFEGHKVSGKDYEGCLKELMDVCVMCNDSELSYNEVSEEGRAGVSEEGRAGKVN